MRRRGRVSCGPPGDGTPAPGRFPLPPHPPVLSRGLYAPSEAIEPAGLGFPRPEHLTPTWATVSAIGLILADGGT